MNGPWKKNQVTRLRHPMQGESFQLSALYALFTSWAKQISGEIGGDVEFGDWFRAEHDAPTSQVLKIDSRANPSPKPPNRLLFDSGLQKKLINRSCFEFFVVKIKIFMQTALYCCNG